MLKAENKLNLSREFSKLKKFGVVLHQPFYTVLYSKSKTNQKKIGFVLSSKVGKAVERNRAKRLLSEVVRANLEKFPEGVDIVFIARSNIKDVKYEDLDLSVNQVLSKIS